MTVQQEFGSALGSPTGGPRSKKADQKSAGPRWGTRTAKLGALVAVAAGFALTPVAAPAANAYDGNSCANGSTVYDVDRFKFNGGPVDFGGGWLNGTPPENAVTCWSLGRKSVQLKGTMYMDAGYRLSSGARFKGCVRITLRFLDSNGNVVASGSTSKDLCDAEGDDWWSQSYDFDRTVTRNVNRALVYAYKKSTTDVNWVLVKTIDSYYGDLNGNVF